jgi:hypothetical protein
MAFLIEAIAAGPKFALEKPPLGCGQHTLVNVASAKATPPPEERDRARESGLEKREQVGVALFLMRAGKAVRSTCIHERAGWAFSCHALLSPRGSVFLRPVFSSA